MLERQQSLKGSDAGISGAQGPRAPAYAGGVKQIDDLLLDDGSGHGDIFGVEIGEGGAQSTRSRDDAGYAKADVISPLVAEDLWRGTRHDGTFHHGRAVRVNELLREGGEKPRSGRSEPDADDV